MLTSWFKNRLTPPKRNSVLWSSIADMIQTVVNNSAEVRLNRLSNKKSLFTMDNEDLSIMIGELGEFFIIRPENSTKKPLILQQRLDEIHFKGTDRPITQTFYREFDGVPLEWQPLYAPVDLDKYPYGAKYIFSDSLKTVGNRYGELFLTSRGAFVISLNELGESWDMVTTSLGIKTNSTSEVIEAIIKRFNEVSDPLMPCHIVNEGYVMKATVTLKEPAIRVGLKETQVTGINCPLGHDIAKLVNVRMVYSGLYIQAGRERNISEHIYDSLVADAIVIDYLDDYGQWPEPDIEIAMIERRDIASPTKTAVFTVSGVQSDATIQLSLAVNMDDRRMDDFILDEE